MKRTLGTFAAALAAAAFLLSFGGRAIAGAGDLTYADHRAQAMETLEHVWYDGGKWRMCLLPQCTRRNQDWGADSLTYDLFLDWESTRDPQIEPYFHRLAETFPRYGAPCGNAKCDQWSDVPAWDAVAALRAYEASGFQSDDLEVARKAYAVVTRSSVYGGGACPSILYQLPFGGPNKLKTLETDSNLIKAAVLLYHFTGNRAYLEKAVARYQAVRRYFLDKDVPLYTVYVFDDGETCEQLQHRFYASVNGNMIDVGLRLYDETGEGRYLHDAIETAKAVDEKLSDERGIFVDQQAENDVTEPLVEAMFDLAREQGQAFARAWILRNAQAALSSRTVEGFSRFFDGPPPQGPITAWQTNGGFALMIAAAALEPDGVPSVDGWQGATFVSDDVTSLPATIEFTGSSIALVGTIGEECCERGHARVFIDGVETFDHRGIWQNKSSADCNLENSILFAWRWERPGRHTLRFEPGLANAKEGSSFLHLRGYFIK